MRRVICMIVLDIIISIRNRSDLNLSLQPLALTILKLGMINVAVSNSGSKKNFDETAPF